MITVAEYILEVLASIEVKRIYGIAGDSLNAFTDTIRKTGKIDWISMRHEEAAAFAAGAESQLSGALTVCAGSCGPGNLHLINGLYDCYRSKTPVLAIAAQIPTAEIGSDYFQETHPERIFTGCSVFCEVISQAEQAPRMIEMAIQAAITLKSVAVLIVPGDIAWQKIKVPQKPNFFSENKNLDDIINALNVSKKTAIFAGIGCASSRQELIELADRLKAPIVHTLRSKEFLDYDNPFDIGLTGLLGLSSAYDALMKCDTLLLLGTDFPYRQFYPENAKIIQIDLHGENIGRRTRVDYGLIGNVENIIPCLLDELNEKTDSSFLEESLKNYRDSLKELEELAVESTDDRPLHPQYLTKMISDLASEDAIFTCDVGTPTVWAARYLRMNGKRRLLGSFKHGSMANALPQAIGAQLQFPSKQVISLSGDGGLAMLMGDLLTLKQYSLPIKVIVFNNSAYSFVELEMKASGLIEFGTELKNPDFAKMAEAIGMLAIQVTRSSDLQTALAKAFEYQGPVLIEVMVDRNELIMPPRITAAEVAGFSLYLMRAVLNGKGDELIELARTNVLNK